MSVENDGKAKQSVNHDIWLARLNVSLAKNQSLVSSWRSKSAYAPPTPTKEEEIEAEMLEDEIFTPIPSTLGLGASLPAALIPGTAANQAAKTDASLRRKLFSKSNPLSRPSSSQVAYLPPSNPRLDNHGVSNVPTKVEIGTVKRGRESSPLSSDEDEGRTVIFSKSRKERKETVEPASDIKPISMEEDISKVASGLPVASEPLEIDAAPVADDVEAPEPVLFLPSSELLLNTSPLSPAHLALLPDSEAPILTPISDSVKVIAADSTTPTPSPKKKKKKKQNKSLSEAREFLNALERDQREAGKLGNNGKEPSKKKQKLKDMMKPNSDGTKKESGWNY